MFGKQNTKLIIVCDDKTKEYANFLRQLISSNDDKEDEVIGVVDGSVDAAVWTEEEYRHNSATISSNEHILFIGENKTSKSEVGSMNILFDEFGMSYGWLGKRAVMSVDDSLLSSSEYKSFVDYCLVYKQYPTGIEYENDKLLQIKDKESKTIETNETKQIKNKLKYNNDALELVNRVAIKIKHKAIKPAANIVENGFVGVYNNMKTIAMKNKIFDQQYRVLTVIFYLDGLRTFLEG